MTDDHGRRLAHWQAVTVALMFVGYTGYYLCRSNLAVTQPLIEGELITKGMSRDDARSALGTIISVGTLAYAAGKFLGGGIGDTIGGRRNFLLGMGGAIVCTVAFALGGGIPVFTAAWVANRFIQSFGWLGVVKIASRWFPFSRYGGVMALLSLSFLFGDAASRQFMGILLGHGLGWRGVFYVTAGVLAGVFVVTLIVLRESPRRLGLAEPGDNPENVFRDKDEVDGTAVEGLTGLYGPLLKSPAFLTVCLLSVGLTFLRETFNNWTSTYFVQGVGLSPGAAASQSAWFPFFGGVSVLLAGFLSDRLGRVGRAAIICLGLGLAGSALAALGRLQPGGSAGWPVALVSLVAFLLIGPYSFLAGAIALDFGGKRGSATASGLIDGIGYVVGGVFAGRVMARVSSQVGWHGVFNVLAWVAWGSCLVAAVFVLGQWRSARAAKGLDPEADGTGG